MRACSAITLLLVAAAALAAEAPDLGFAPTLPAAIGDVSSWEVVSGSFDTTAIRGGYVFYVNPSRQALYQVMRYRTSVRADRSLGPERVMFVRRPGTDERVLCWERQAAPPGWRVVAPDTPEYRADMAMLIRVLALHRAARAGR